MKKTIKLILVKNCLVLSSLVQLRRFIEYWSDSFYNHNSV